jgi:hypothetical protein
LLALAACALRDVPGPPGREQIVVQGVLNAQASRQVLWIERTIAAGEVVDGAVRPLAVPPSRIEVRDSTGQIVNFQLDSTNTARFTAAFTPTPGWRYDLLIEAGLQVLTASTRVPNLVTIVDPASDTVTMPRDSFPLTWSGPIRTVRVALADTAGRATFAPSMWVSADTATRLTNVAYVPSSISAIQVWVVAVDSVTARMRQPQSLFGPFGDAFTDTPGNVSGGVGFFGAVTADHIVVRFH